MATEEDKTNTGALLTLVAVGTFVMVGISLAVTAITREELGRAGAEKEAPGNHAYQALRGEQLAKLASGATPIDQAMQQVVSGLQRDPNSATPPAAAGTAAPVPTGSTAEAAPSAAAPAPSAAAPAPSAAAPAPSAAAPAPSAAAPVQKAAPTKQTAPQKTVAPAAEPGTPKPVPAPAAAPAPAPAPPSSAHG